MNFKYIYLVFVFNILTSYAEYIPPGPLYNCPSTPEEIKLIFPCICEKGSDLGLYVRCENVGIAILSAGLRNIATFNMPIEELTLNELNLGRLYGPLFHKLKVRILKIENTPIKKIDKETFYGVNKTLQNLYLLNSQLNEFPIEAFKILGNLSILHIDNHKMNEIDKHAFKESLSIGKLERLHIINGILSELHIETFQPLKKLKTLDLHGNSLSALKKNQFKDLRNVEALDLSFNNITKLESIHIADLTQLIWFNVSHNHLSEFSRGMFARNLVIKVLHMNHNKIKRIDTNSIRGVRYLRRLYLSDNEISEVGRGAFGAISKIGTIDLARNNIKKIDFQMFHQLNLVEIIDLSENKITEIQKLSFKDLYLTNINISHNLLTKIENGAFENCANITVLDLSYNNLTTIPKNAFDATTYATELQLSYNKLTVLNQVPLHNMTGLKTLNVSHNMITSITKNTFPKLYELHTVDVSYNQLNEIANAVFQTLFSLRYLNLSHNSLEQIKPPTFGTLPTLLELDLSHNLLTDISKGALTKLASCGKMEVSNNKLEKIFQMPISLGDFNLSHNNISEIPANVWPTMNALLKLDLSHNPIGTGLSVDSFRGLLTLQTLILTETKLERPPWEALSTLTSLQYLKLENNNITNLDKAAFGRLPIVFDLDLSNNQISTISEKAFDGLLQLLRLSLSNNNISHIPNGAFRGLVSLRSIDLSHNYLEKLDNKTNGLLDDCFSIENVNLSHNKISFITKKTFPNDPYQPYKLRTIDLSYNVMPVITKDIILGAKQLEVLNISNNILSGIRKGVIGNLTRLRHLDLSHNTFSDLSSEKDMFKLPSNISVINLSSNKLLRLPIDHLKNARNLAVLDIRNNSLEFFDENLVPKIKNSDLRVYFSGNPLKCDCFTRPLKHYLNHLPKKNVEDKIYSSIICSNPNMVKDIPFIAISDDQLNCNENVALREKIIQEQSEGSTVSKYDIEPDLIFREVQFSQNNILVQWYVQSFKDIADFKIIIRNSNNDLFYSEIIPYNERSLLIEIKYNEKLREALENKTADLELCILSGNTQTQTFSWFGSQCKMLPNDFQKLNKDIVTKTIQFDVYNIKKRNYKSLKSDATVMFKSNFMAVFLVQFLIYIYL